MGLFGKSSSPIGLDISSNTIRAVQLKPYSPKPVIVKYAETTIGGAVSDGEVTDVDMVADAITQMWKSNNINERQVVLGISNQKVIVRLITMPQMKDDELKSAIEFQAQDHIPIPVEEAIIDYQVVGEFSNEDKEQMIEVILVAAQKDMVTNQIQTLEKAKLKPYVVDLSSFALVRSLLEKQPIVPEDKDFEQAKQAVGLVDIGEDVTNIVIAENYVPRFTRVTSVADNTFTKAIADSMGIDLEQAERLKNTHGFPAIAKAKKAEKPAKTAKAKKKVKKEEKEKADKTKEVLEDEAIRFISELKRSFDYAVSESVKADKIEKIILTGKGSTIPNLVDQLKASFRCDIEKGNPLVSISLDGDESFEAKSSNYAISVGLALRGLEE